MNANYSSLTYQPGSRLLEGKTDLDAIFKLVEQLPGGATIPDLEENLLVPTIRQRVRLWFQGDVLTAFAYVDDYHNLWFEQLPAAPDEDAIGNEIVQWGCECMRKINTEDGEEATLDHSCSAEAASKIAFLLRNGFQQDNIRSLHYSRPGNLPVLNFTLPPGMFIRCVKGEEEVEVLTDLHRAAFGTDHMTVDERLAIMRTDGYRRDLDLVICRGDGTLIGFCVCSLDESNQIGYTDPIGVHPAFHGQGLGKSILQHGISLLQELGVREIRLGTSSENIAMQRLAENCGFILVSEVLWFSKQIPVINRP